MTSITTMSNATGAWSALPPYGLADGPYVVQAQRRKAGVWGPLGSGVALTMPNAAKTATLGIISRMSVAPPAGRAEAMYALISALMGAGVWDKLDILHPLAAHDTQAARLNWIGPAYDLAAYNSPLFTANRGFKGDGAAAYLEAAGYNPSGGGTKYTRNDASLGAWILTPTSVTGLDVYTGTGRLTRRYGTGDDYHYRINDEGSYYGPGGSTPAFHAADRAGATAKRMYRDGALIGSGAVASTGNATYLRLFSSGASLYSTAEIAAVFAGASLTDAQHAAIYAALRTYLVTVGAIIA